MFPSYLCKARRSKYPQCAGLSLDSVNSTSFLSGLKPAKEGYPVTRLLVLSALHFSLEKKVEPIRVPHCTEIGTLVAQTNPSQCNRIIANARRAALSCRDTITLPFLLANCCRTPSEDEFARLSGLPHATSCSL